MSFLFKAAVSITDGTLAPRFHGSSSSMRLMGMIGLAA
jgi:hypothetical protein